MTGFAAVEAFRGGPGVIRVVGHRGARGVLPENTMIGFEFALSTGAPLLEFDVVLTADNVPVITHNHRLHAPTFRTPDGAFLKGEEPKVASVTWDEIRQFDIGRLDGASPYGQRFPDQAQMDGLHVPRLSELLDLVAGPEHARSFLMLELKSDPDLANDPEHRAAFTRIVIEEVRARGLAERVLMHSFDWKLLAECQKQAPDIPGSYLTELPENEDEVGEDSSQSVSPDFPDGVAGIPRMVLKAGGRLWCPYVHDVTAASVAEAHALGLCVAVWTVNEIEDIDRMIACQVDAIVSDYPGRVQRRLSDHGMRWLDP